MIPNIELIATQIPDITRPTRTYRIVFADNFVNKATGITVTGMVANLTGEDRISGFITGLEAVVQTIYLILSTERYKYLIYSWDYGVELFDLIGKPIPFVMAELPRRITEALTQDDRITNVTDFEFERNGKVLHTTFTVVTTIGNITTNLEVNV